MKLRNKKTGEIGYLHSDSDGQIQAARNTGYNYKHYDTLAELVEEWEDAPESEGHWHIRDGEVYWSEIKPCIRTEKRKEIGNYFETKEEAERAVEKLKAWKRLKDRGLEFNGWILPDRKIGLSLPASFFPCKGRIDKETEKDLDICFGDE